MGFSEDLLQSIHKHVRNKTLSNVVMGIVFALIGVAMILGDLLSESDVNDGFLLVVGLTLGLFGGLGAAWYGKRHVDLASILRTEPARVVWVYLKQNAASVEGIQLARFHFVVFGLADKRRLQIRLSAHDAQRLVAEAQSVLPQAVHGYSEDVERAFRRDPAAMQGFR